MKPTSRPHIDEDTDADDSFFDLVLKSPDSVALTRRHAVEEDFHFINSPRDVFLTRNDFSDSKPLYKVTLLRSTPKIRVFMLGFGKSSKCETLECNGDAKLSRFPKSSKIEESNSLSVTCRVEKTPTTCRVAGENSLRSQILKETLDSEKSLEKSVKGSLPKYLKLIRPLYLMVWKRQQQDRTKFTESSTPLGSPAVNLSPKRISDVSRMGSFKMAARRLGKSRSVSRAAPRRDDSLLERHDGIQNAVLYCKKSYNSSSKEISKLFESSMHMGRSSCEEEPKRCSI